MNKTYTAKPIHFLFSIILFSIGVGLQTTGIVPLVIISIAFYVSSAGSFVVILVAGTVPHYTEYWNKVNQFSETMLRHRNPELWHALGFTPPPEPTVVRLLNVDNGEGFEQIEIARPPISIEAMQIIAHGILKEDKKFSEGEWVNKNKIVSSAKYRKLQKYLEGRKYIKLNNTSNPKMGYTFTRYGMSFLGECLNGNIKSLSNTNPLSVPPSL